MRMLLLALVLVARSAFADGVVRFEPGLDEKGFFPRAAPPASVDGATLERIIRGAEASHSHALIVIKAGRVLVERYFGHPEKPLVLMSVTKSIVSLAAGLLLAEHKIPSLDAPLSTWWPEWATGQKAKVTLKHVLTQSSGLQHRPMAGYLYQQPDRVAFVRSSEVVDEPGKKFSYSNEGTELLSGILRAAAGRPVDQYLDEKLFRPLGITAWSWDRDQAGNVNTFADLSLHPRDLARIGQLLLDGGKWHGQQLVPADWVRLSTAPSSEQAPFYGLLWWIIPGERTVMVTEDRLGQLAKTGFAAAAKLQPLVGKVFPRAERLLLEAGALLSAAERDQLAGLLEGGQRLTQIHTGAPIGFRGDGWLGQYLFVVPKEQLVVVRMHAPEASNDEAENEQYGFRELLDLTLSLVRRPP